MTLAFLGSVGDEVVPSLVASLRGLAGWREANGGAVVAALGPETGAFGRSLLHVPVAGLDGLAAAVVAACAAGFGDGGEAERPFTGHVTLARAGRRDRGVDLRRLAGQPVPAAAQARWPVQEVTLVRSIGDRYEVLERVALA